MSLPECTLAGPSPAKPEQPIFLEDACETAALADSWMHVYQPSEEVAGEADSKQLADERSCLEDALNSLANAVQREVALHHLQVERLFARQQERLGLAAEPGAWKAVPTFEAQLQVGTPRLQSFSPKNRGGSKPKHFSASPPPSPARMPPLVTSKARARPPRRGSKTSAPAVYDIPEVKVVDNQEKDEVGAGNDVRQQSDPRLLTPMKPSPAKLQEGTSMDLFDDDDQREALQASYNKWKGKTRAKSQIFLGWAGFETHNALFLPRDKRFLPDNWFFRMFRAFVASRPFSTTVACLILCNAVFIGVVSDGTLRRIIRRYDAFETPISLSAVAEPWEEVVDISFTCIFATEILLRIIALELSFFIGPDWRWNLLDCATVVMAILEALLLRSEFEVTWTRLFRLIRLLRSVRVIRVLRFFRQLRLMLVSVLHSLIPLVWAVVFLLLVLFVFSVIVADGVAQSFSDSARTCQAGLDASCQVDVLQRYFGSVPMVILSHFIAVTGGISWWELGDLLASASWVYSAVFIMYVMVMVLMVLNIITGIFVNDAVEIAQTDRDFATEATLHKEASIFKELEGVFRQLDADNDGILEFKEFQLKIQEPDTRAIFSALNLDVSDAVRFFKLLDVDNSHKLEIDEFVMGCMNIKGQVKTISMEAMMHENKRMMRRYMRGQRSLEAQVREIIEHIRAWQDAEFSDGSTLGTTSRDFFNRNSVVDSVP